MLELEKLSDKRYNAWVIYKNTKYSERNTGTVK